MRKRDASKYFSYQLMLIPFLVKAAYIILALVLARGVEAPGIEGDLATWLYAALVTKGLMGTVGLYAGFFLIRQDHAAVGVARTFILTDLVLVVAVNTILMMHAFGSYAHDSLGVLTAADLVIIVGYYVACLLFLRFSKSAKQEFRDRKHSIDPLNQM